jgi:tetratricopeptide (TPR) repeat protein
MLSSEPGEPRGTRVHAHLKIPNSMKRNRMMSLIRAACVAVLALACGCAQKAGLDNYARGMDSLSRGEYEEAVEELEACVRLDAEEPEFANRLAWVLATCPRRGIRDGQRAVSLATQACEATRWGQPYKLDTLAASYAEAGDFDEAVRWQEKALSLLPDDLYRAMYRGRLDLYKGRSPYREGLGL